MAVVELTPSPAISEAQDRVVDAALRCVARWGVGKTTLDDVAREAGLSRATVYRLVPGGKDGLMQLVVQSELHRFFTALADPIERAESLDDALVGAITEATKRLRSHRALQFLLAHEPEQVLPRIAFGHLDHVLRRVASVTAPLLARWLPAEDAVLTAEWVTRIVLSYVMTPSSTFDLTDLDSTRRLVRTFVLPGLRVSA